MHSLYPLSVLYALISVISAQQTPAELAAQIPTCVVPCDTSAIAAVGCGGTDYACHCQNSDRIKSLALPCLQNNSTCTSSQLQTFGTLVAEICQNLNVTANATTILPSTATPIPTSSTTLVPFKGDASALRFNNAVVSLLGVAFIGYIL